MLVESAVLRFWAFIFARKVLLKRMQLKLKDVVDFTRQSLQSAHAIIFFFFFTPGLSCSSEKETCKQMANSSFLSEKKKSLFFDSMLFCFTGSWFKSADFLKKRQQHIFPGDLSFLSTSSLANVSGLVLVSWTVWLVFWPNLFSINCDYSPLLKEVKLNCLSCASYFKIFS